MTFSPALGEQLNVDMSQHWRPEQSFFSLLRDKAALRQQLAALTGEPANEKWTASLMQAEIQRRLDAKPPADYPDHLPGYFRFPLAVYDRAEGMAALDAYRKLTVTTDDNGDAAKDRDAVDDAA